MANLRKESPMVSSRSRLKKSLALDIVRACIMSHGLGPPADDVSASRLKLQHSTAASWHTSEMPTSVWHSTELIMLPEYDTFLPVTEQQHTWLAQVLHGELTSPLTLSESATHLSFNSNCVQSDMSVHGATSSLWQTASLQQQWLTEWLGLMQQFTHLSQLLEELDATAPLSALSTLIWIFSKGRNRASVSLSEDWRWPRHDADISCSFIELSQNSKRSGGQLSHSFICPSAKPMRASTAMQRRSSSATRRQFMRYNIAGRQTAFRHNDAGNGCTSHSSGTSICFCWRFSRLARRVTALLVGSATPFWLT